VAEVKSPFAIVVPWIEALHGVTMSSLTSVFGRPRCGTYVAAQAA